MELPEIQVLSIYFRNMPLEIQESMVMTRVEADRMLEQLSETGSECAILSTCDRIEIYTAECRGSDTSAAVLLALRAVKPELIVNMPRCRIYHARGEAAAAHLLRVSSGLDSVIMGDGHILDQVKDAWRLAGTRAGHILGYLFLLAIRTGMRVRRDTDISWGSAGLGSAVASILKHHPCLKRLEPELLIVGSGQAARDVGRQFSKRRMGRLLVTARDGEKAAGLAREIGAETRPWDGLYSSVESAAATVFATSGRYPILKAARLARPEPGCARLLIDIGLPRNVEPVHGADIINILSIRDQQGESLRRRIKSVPDVERMLGIGMESWRIWRDTRPIEHLLADIYKDAADFSRRAVSELLAARDTHEAGEKFMSAFKRFMNPHVKKLRELEAQQTERVSS
jgi:glutamyl-tRNA reductase